MGKQGKTTLWFSICALIIIMNSCTPSLQLGEEAKKPSERTFVFSQIEWVVRTSDGNKEGPGPNLFSNSNQNVWVDKDGKLHLKITQKAGYWYCAGITAKKSFGYGKYVFYIASDITQLDDNVVVGLFTYLNDEEEIDIEFSKWSDSNNKNSQFAVQPADKQGNKERFEIQKGKRQTIHSFEWKADQIKFFSAEVGNDSLLNPLHQWVYTGGDIPPEKNEKLKLNLWLFKGQMPVSLKEQELIVDSIKFISFP